MNGKTNVACGHCHRYVSEGTPKWADAWPATIWSMLAKKGANMKYMAAEFVVSCLPREIRRMWTDQTTFHPTVVALWENQQASFMDVTLLAQKGKARKTSSLMSMVEYLEQTVFPNIKCCMGCNLFVSDLHENPPQAQLIPFAHYFNLKNPKICSQFVRSRRNLFRGKRPDWPRVKISYECWPTGSALVQDDQKGLCVMVCGNHVHSFGTDYVHIPRNPALEDLLITPNVDPCAGLKIVPKVITAGKLHRFVKSYDVVLQQGNAGGLSSFTISPHASFSPPLCHEQYLAQSLVLENRDDIRDALINRGDKDFVDEMHDFYLRNVTPQLTQNIEQCKDSGNFMSQGDATFLSKTFNKRQLLMDDGSSDDEVTVSGLSNDNWKARNKMNDPIRYIHPNDIHGLRPPPNTKIIQMRKRKNTPAPVVSDNAAYASAPPCDNPAPPTPPSSDEPASPLLPCDHPATPFPSHGDNDPHSNTDTIDHNAGAIYYTLLQILSKCPSVHRLFLESLWRNKFPQFTKNIQIGVAGLLHAPCRSISKADMLRDEREIVNFVDEISRLEDPKLMDFVFIFLDIIIPDLHCARTRIDRVRDCLRSEEFADKDVVMLRVHGSPRAEVLDSVNEFSLVLKSKIIPGISPNFYELVNQFRWLPQHWFQDSGTKPYNPRELPEVLIYVKNRVFDALSKEDLVSWSGGQRSVMCAVHHQFLIRMNDPYLTCCWRDKCKRLLKWRCPYGLRQHAQCKAGVCLPHGKADDNTDIHPPNDPPCVPVVEEEPDNSDSEPEEVNNLNNPLDEFRHTSDDDSGADSVENYDFGMGLSNIEPVDGVPLMTTGNRGPVYADSSNLSALNLDGRFLFNDVLRANKQTGLANWKSGLNIGTKTILNCIVASNPNTNVPMTQPAAFFHPSVFWTTSRFDPHSVLGAEPAILYAPENGPAKLGLASLEDHVSVRLRDNDCLASHDQSSLHWMGDAWLNQKLRYNSAAVLVRKGPEFLATKRDGHRIDSRETQLNFDEIDARRAVNKLSSYMRDVNGFDFFFTCTCNDNETLGMRELKRVIVTHYDRLREKAFCRNDKYFPSTDDVLEAHGSIFCRVWCRVLTWFLDWLRFSTDKPCGNVTELWGRFEWQSGQGHGNKPHLHGLLKISGEEEEQKLSRIRGMLSGIFGDESLGTDMKSLLNSGVIRYEQEYAQLQELCAMLQIHVCERGNQRCMVENNDGNVSCRVQRHPPSREYKFDVNNNLYDSEFVDILSRLGLTVLNRFGDTVPIKELQGGRYQVPAIANETFSPTFPWLFFTLRAVTNVQYLDGRMAPTYLTKYCAGKDDKRRCHVKKIGPDEVRVYAEDLQNEKRPGARARADKKIPQYLAREFSRTEMFWSMNKLPFVISDCEYSHINTNPPEYRSVIFKPSKSRPSRLEGSDGFPAAVREREHFEPWRQFTETQVAIIRQLIDGSYNLDGTSRFSLRPPELIIFDNLLDYCCWFKQQCTSVHGNRLNDDIEKCPWVDGAGHLIKVRQWYVNETCMWIRSIVDDSFHPRQEHAQFLWDDVFEHLALEVDADKHSDVYLRFVDVSDSACRRNVVVPTPILPFQLPKFLIHLCLTMGNFDTEFDLWAKGNLAEAMVYAGVISSVTPPEEEIFRLISRYIMTELRWAAVSTRQFVRSIQHLMEALPLFFSEGRYLWEACPVAWDQAISDKASDELDRLESLRRSTAIDALGALGLPNFPDAILVHGPHREQDPDSLDQLRYPTHLSDYQRLLQGIPFDLDMTLQRAPGQSAESFEEQSSALRIAASIVDQRFVPGRNTSSLYPLITGAPGTGKSYVLMMLFLYCLSKGLSTTLTSFTSVRARQMGGIHLHKLFCLPGSEGPGRTATILSEMALSRLVDRPVQLCFLKRLKVLMVEEASLIAAEYWATMDYVLRAVKDSPIPFGGVLIIANGDHHQLAPINGHNFFTSHHIVTTFKILQLKESVRAAHDEDMRRMLQTVRILDPTDDEIEDFKNIFRNRISANFVSDWSLVPPDCLHIMSTRQAVNTCIDRHVREMSRNVDVYRFLGIDWVETTAGQWGLANKSVSKLLDKKCNEPSELYLHASSIMRLTYNSVSPSWSQGQLCIVIDLPPRRPDDDQPGATAAERERWSTERRLDRVTVRLVPPGVDQVDVDNVPADWPIVHLPRRETIPIDVDRGRALAMRWQFGLCYHVASTIHRILGCTCHRIATKISEADKTYHIWSRDMLYVLLSRTRTMDHLYFVGDREPTLSAMETILRRKNAVMGLIDITLNRLNAIGESTRVVRSACVQLSVEIPNSKIGFCYMLVSADHPDRAYVGECSQVKRRLGQHNACNGSTFTAQSQFIPWTIMVLVVGFPGDAGSNDIALKELNRKSRKEFETAWHKNIAQVRNRHQISSTHETYRQGRIVFQQFRAAWTDLRWLDCARVTTNIA